MLPGVRTRQVSLLVILVLATSACAAASILRGAGARALVVTPAVRAPLGGAAASEGFVAHASARSALSPVLRSATQGRRSAPLVIDDAGWITVSRNQLARFDFRTGELWQGSNVVGRLRNGTLVEYGSQGEQVIGYIRGTVPAKLLRNRRSPASGELLASVEAIRQGKYLIRFGNSASYWVDGALATLLFISAEEESRSTCPSGPGLAVRHSGEVVRFDTCRDDGGLRLLQSPSGVLVVDSFDLSAIIPSHSGEGA